MINYCCFSPHPPIVIPEVGGDNLTKAQATVKGLQAMAAELVASAPEVVFLLTPHGNVFSDCISCLGEQELNGNLGAFGHQEINMHYTNDLELVSRLEQECAAEGIEFAVIDRSLAKHHHLNAELDHGIMIPLYYLEQAGLKKVPIVAISIGFLPLVQLYKLGTVISRCARTLKRKAALVASGDMSHRLKDDGPYSFNPAGPEYDHLVKDLLDKKDIKSLLSIPEHLRENAGECGYRSLVIMLGALDGFDFESRVFSYEGPFGVGYLTAGFKPTAPGASFLEHWLEEEAREREERRSLESIPVKWARRVVESYIKSGQIPTLPEDWAEIKQQKAAVFVSLKKSGQLRGCIGTILPVHDNLMEEIQENAISASTRDPRFNPVRPEELDQLEYSVDVLSKPEPATRGELDPSRYGVIVSRGSKRGVLLPNLEGVDTVEEQLEIALQKAGISRTQGYSIERFEVVRYK
jgi:AmmeMemoRadiSam system protein A